MDSVATGAAQVRAGALRGIATTGARRSEALPDLPTVAEAIPGFEATTWNAVLAPAGTPAPMVQAMSAAIWKALGDPATQARVSELGVQAPTLEERSPAATGRFIALETAKWERLIRNARITVE
jgi:tripartite-type tricarboxylate transporter receptor subunit TctC